MIGVYTNKVYNLSTTSLFISTNWAENHKKTGHFSKSIENRAK